MSIGPEIREWMNILFRWAHIIAGILWVGQTYFFTWLDGRFMDEGGQVWMVHSGGFYVFEKQKAPAAMPKILHWFRWEAAITWITGFVLLTLVYYMGGIMVDESIYRISVWVVTGIGIAVLVFGWVFYDLLAQSPLGKSETAFATVCYVLLVGVIYGLAHVMSGRAAYIHIGALFGTIMTANVWMRILPAQRKMVAALKAGAAPDQELAARAKIRSKHNTFMVVPLVFTMISNHFPSATYGSRNNWLVLAILVLAGWAAARVMRSF